MPTDHSYQQLPVQLRRPVRDYIEFGVRPDNFLSAVIANNLREAVGLADSTITTEVLRTLCVWFYVEAPVMCQGSDERIQLWCAMGGKHGIDARVQRDRAEVAHVH